MKKWVKGLSKKMHLAMNEANKLQPKQIKPRWKRWGLLYATYFESTGSYCIQQSLFRGGRLAADVVPQSVFIWEHPGSAGYTCHQSPSLAQWLLDTVWASGLQNELQMCLERKLQKNEFPNAWISRCMNDQPPWILARKV